MDEFTGYLHSKYGRSYIIIPCTLTTDWKKQTKSGSVVGRVEENGMKFSSVMTMKATQQKKKGLIRKSVAIRCRRNR
jgi:hypothetical protein